MKTTSEILKNIADAERDLERIVEYYQIRSFATLLTPEEEAEQREAELILKMIDPLTTYSWKHLL